VRDRSSDTLALSPIHDSASSRSLRAQRRFFRLTVALLALAAVIALTGALPAITITNDFDVSVLPSSDGVNLFGVLAMLAFGATFVVRRTLDVQEPQRAWYDGRAVAESVKSLAWRYSVGGAPFFGGGHPHALPSDRADDLLLSRITEVVEQFHTDGTRAPVDASQITDRMRSVRATPLAERRAAYARDRVGDQEAWYRSKAAWNERRAKQWSRASLALEVGGLAAAVVIAGGWLEEVDLLGIVATILAAIVAWTNAKQHTTLAESYLVAAQDLRDIQAGVDRETTEEAWAEFVANAEAAMSREHTVWRARRSVPTAA
jgi:hypothetical protein